MVYSFPIVKASQKGKFSHRVSVRTAPPVTVPPYSQGWLGLIEAAGLVLHGILRALITLHESSWGRSTHDREQSGSHVKNWRNSRCVWSGKKATTGEVHMTAAFWYLTGWQEQNHLTYSTHLQGGFCFLSFLVFLLSFFILTCFISKKKEANLQRLTWHQKKSMKF